MKEIWIESFLMRSNNRDRALLEHDQKKSNVSRSYKTYISKTWFRTLINMKGLLTWYTCDLGVY